MEVSVEAGERRPELPLDFRSRVAEHGRVRAVLESFAYLPPFAGGFNKSAPFYAESYWYCMGGITFLMFVYLTLTGIVLAWLGPFWWLDNSFGIFLKGTHYWAAQAFFFFLVLHLIRVWATGSYRGRRVINWLIGSSTLFLGLLENLFGLLARGDWESQFVAMHSDDMLFTQPFFFNLLGPGNFVADLAIHTAVIPVIMFALILGHLTLVRLQGIARPL